MIFLIAVLLLIGLGLIFCEVFIPGGVVGIIGALFMLGGVVLTFAEYGFVQGLALLLFAVLAAGMAVIFAINRLPRTQVGQWILLGEEEKKTTGYHADAYSNSMQLGREGIADSELRPAGIAIFDGQRYDVISEGEFIESGTPIRVMRVDGNRIVVERI